MYDTISLYLPAEKATGIDLIAEMPVYLSDLKENFNHASGIVTVSGKCDNFHVTASIKGIFLNGSLPKYHFGQNQSTLNLQSTKNAIAKLSQALNLPLSEAFVYRIDFAENYIMSHPVASYFESLGESRYYKRLDQGSSLYYNSGRRQIVFYDKVKEQSAKNYDIASKFAGQNVLRYEYRLKKRVADQMNCPEVRASDLHDPVFYKQLLLRYHKEYSAIHKLSPLCFNSLVMGDVRALRSQLSLYGIQALGGEKAVLEMLDSANRRNEFSSTMQYNRSKKMVKEVCQMPLLAKKSELIQELDMKINNHIQEEISSL